jgi:hypothetical protein
VPLLFYWQRDNYLRDRAYGFGFHLNQSSPAMARVRPGESIWAFTQRRRDRTYVLAAELIVKAVTRNPPGYHYGTHRAWGSLETTRYFDTDVGRDVEPVIRALTIRTDAEHLGQAFQGPRGVRPIAATDHQLLVAVAAELPLWNEAHTQPEPLVLPVRAPEDGVLREEPALYVPFSDKRRREYLHEHVDYARDRRLVGNLQDLYAGRCQLCLFNPLDRYGLPLCEGHHIQWLSRGGTDEMQNMALLCPNHHAAVHRDDAPFEYGDLSFLFATAGREHIRLNTHLPLAH